MGRKLDPMSQAALDLVEHESREAFDNLPMKKRREFASTFLTEAAGSLKTLRYYEAQSSLRLLMKLRQIKESRVYKELGLTWADYCESIGMKRKTIDTKLSDLKPFADEFLASIGHFSEFDFNKIKHLSNAVLADVAKIEGASIVYGKERVEVSAENVEAVQELIDRISSDLGRRAEDAEADASAHRRISKDKEKVIRKLEGVIQKLERKAEKEGLTSEEAGFRRDLENTKTIFDGLFAKVDPERLAGEFGDSMTPMMQAELVSALVYIHRAARALHDTATDIYGEHGE